MSSDTLPVRTFDVVIELSGRGCTASAPAVRGCFGTGRTEDEAVENLRDSLIQWLRGWHSVAAKHNLTVRQIEITLEP